ncbi:MAG: hypothetical protein QXK24_07960 [Ignisphaera sp.]
MPKKKVPTIKLRENQYVEKAYKWRTGGGLAPEDVRRLAYNVVQDMHSSWKGVFGRFSETWWNAVVAVLEAHNIPKLEYAKYRAFVNRYISKVLIKGSQKPEHIKDEFVDLQGCDPAVLDEITAKIGEVFR